MVYRISKRTFLKSFLSFPLTFLIPDKRPFHFQFTVSFPKEVSKDTYLFHQKRRNQKKLQIISSTFIANNQILSISEESDSNYTAVSIVFDSKHSFSLWHTIINDPKVFNTEQLNNLGFKLDYKTKV